MKQSAVIPHLFRTEYQKIVAVLCKLFGIAHIEIAEDIVSDTFLLATELWGLKGVPENPTAWLYVVAKNKTRDYLKHHAVFYNTIAKNLQYAALTVEEVEIDLSAQNIHDSQLAMIFVVCHPCNPPEAQISLALNLLCGFGIEEIANAFLTNKEVIYKRLQRARAKLRDKQISIEQPSVAAIDERLPSVLMTLYLLFNEGYYSLHHDITVRKDLCYEAMRLIGLLIENGQTNKPAVNALRSLMCFHASRLDARVGENGELILYHNQDTALWNHEMIARGEYYLRQSSRGDTLSKFHLEAAIAYWHTNQLDSKEKWDNILQLYNHLLVIEYSPITALNRTYALAKANGRSAAIEEAEKIQLKGNFLYHSLLGELYGGIDKAKAIAHFEDALSLAKTAADKKFIANKIVECRQCKVE